MLALSLFGWFGTGFGLATAMFVPLMVFTYQRGHREAQILKRIQFQRVTEKVKAAEVRITAEAEKEVAKRTAELEAKYAKQVASLANRESALIHERERLDAGWQKVTQKYKDTEEEFAKAAEEMIVQQDEAYERRVEAMEAELQRKFAGDGSAPPNSCLIHTLTGKSLVAKFYVARGGRVTIDWSADTKFNSSPRVVANRVSGKARDDLFSEMCDKNRFSETLRPASYLYQFAVYDGESVVEEAKYRLSVPTNEELEEMSSSDGEGSSPPWLRKVRDKMRSEVKLVSLVKELQKAAHVEIDGLGLSPEDREAAFARIDFVAANFMGDGS